MRLIHHAETYPFDGSREATKKRLQNMWVSRYVLHQPLQGLCACKTISRWITKSTRFASAIAGALCLQVNNIEIIAPPSLLHQPLQGLCACKRRLGRFRATAPLCISHCRGFVLARLLAGSGTIISAPLHQPLQGLCACKSQLNSTAQSVFCLGYAQTEVGKPESTPDLMTLCFVQNMVVSSPIEALIYYGWSI